MKLCSLTIEYTHARRDICRCMCLVGVYDLCVCVSLSLVYFLSIYVVNSVPSAACAVLCVGIYSACHGINCTDSAVAGVAFQCVAG